MSVLLIQQAFNQAKADVRAGAGQLRKDRDDIDRRVTGFLNDGWSGLAADSFVDAWDDWKVAASDVLEGLVSMGQLLEAAQQDFNQEDAGSQQKLDRISERIIERLG